MIRCRTSSRCEASLKPLITHDGAVNFNNTRTNLQHDTHNQQACNNLAIELLVNVYNACVENVHNITHSRMVSKIWRQNLGQNGVKFKFSIK
jgi:hypothetical protein